MFSLQHADTVDALVEVFDAYFVAVDRLVNASKTLLQQNTGKYLNLCNAQCGGS